MSTVLYTAVNNVVGLSLAAPHTSGTSTFLLNSGGSLFPATLPTRMTVTTSGTYQTLNETNTVFSVISMSGNTVTVTPQGIENTLDRNYASGDKVDLRLTAQYITDLSVAVTPVVNTSLVANGTSQATATFITTPPYYGNQSLQIFTTVTSGNNGASLPPVVANSLPRLTVVNIGTYPLSVYPSGTNQINSMSGGIAHVIPVGGSTTYAAISTTAWQTVSVGTGPSTSIFNTPGTFQYTAPLGTTRVKMVTIGGGGGGGGAACGSGAFGGAGGGGGCYAECEWRSNDLQYPLSVVVGAGGGSGLPGASTGGSGGLGGVGNASIVIGSGGQYYCYGGAGGAGNSGTFNTPFAIASYGFSDWQGGIGGTSALGGAATAGTPAIGKAASGGGGGGGISLAIIPQNAAAGGKIAMTAPGSVGGNLGLGGAAGNPGGNGTNGFSAVGLTTTATVGGGGGGGGGATSGVSSFGGIGGVGGYPGGGGGGGGAAPANIGSFAGAGGLGGNGLVVLFAS